MTNKLFSILLVAAIAFASCGQSESKTTTTPTAASPSTSGAAVDPATFTTIEWLDSTFDKGTITEGEKIELAYRFKNTGDKPLIIENVQVSCGCTVAEKPQEPIAPGKEGVIKAVFNSENKQGKIHKTVTVTANTERRSYPLTFDLVVNKKS